MEMILVFKQGLIPAITKPPSLNGQVCILLQN